MNADVWPIPVRARVRLGQCAPLRVGDLDVLPAERRVVWTDGEDSLEPRVMQVLVALLDAHGAVVTRDELVERCWDGRIVGDDALVRVVSRLRKLGEASGAFAIETVAKVGYRLRAAASVEAISPQPEALARPLLTTPSGSPDPAEGSESEAHSAAAATGSTKAETSRRALLAAGLAGAAALAGGGIWLSRRPDPRAADAARLYAEGVRALGEALPERDAQGLGFLREATRLAPDDASTWGKLALAYVATAEYARGEDERAALSRARAAAARALELDPNQGDALTALATIPPVFGRWAQAETGLRRVLARAPGNAAASAALATLLMSAGRVAETAAINQRLHAANPLSPSHGYRWLYALWSMGRIEEADRAAERLRALWPRHPALWNVQWLIRTHTGRAGQARAMARDVEGRPARMAPALAERLAEVARAMETRAPGDVARAVAGQLAAARTSPYGAIGAVMALSGLGALDESIAVASAYLLGRGPLAMPARAAPGDFVHNDQRHRKTMMLFVPASANLRADPRFATLMRDIGLAAYWRQAGVVPDYRRD